VVKNNQICLSGRNHRSNLVDLSFAHICFGIWTVTLAKNLPNNRPTSRFGKQTHFFHLILKIGLAKI